MNDFNFEPAMLQGLPFGQNPNLPLKSLTEAFMTFIIILFNMNKHKTNTQNCSTFLNNWSDFYESGSETKFELLAEVFTDKIGNIKSIKTFFKYLICNNIISYEFTTFHKIGTFVKFVLLDLTNNTV